MSEIKLLPCPFCGGEAEMVVAHHCFKNPYVVICKNDECRASKGQFSNTKEEAIAAWNQRKPMERILERLEKLTEKHMNNSEKAAELGKAYERHMIFNGAKGTAFEEAIDIVKEEGGLND